MSKPDWTQWILKKNLNSIAEELQKNLEELEKSVKPDTYDHEKHNYPNHYPDMSDKQTEHHLKLYSNANSGAHSAPASGSDSSGEHETDNFAQSQHHYLKTGKALKFNRGKDHPQNVGTKERKHFDLDSLSSKPKLPK